MFDDIDRMKLIVMQSIEQMRAEFQEWFDDYDCQLEAAILEELDKEQTEPELSIIYGMAKIFYFEAALKRDPPGRDLTKGIVDKEPEF